MFRSKSRVERRVVRNYWDDGLVDLLSGIGVLLVGIAWQCNLVALGAVAPAMLIPFWKPLRKQITEPRLGYVEFSDAQERRQRRFLVWTVGAGCLAFAVAIGFYFFVNLSDGGPAARNWVAALPACLIGGLAASVSLVILVPRFLFYGIGFAMAGVVVVLLDWEPGVAMIAGSVLVLLYGSIRLSVFLHSHPVRPIESSGT